MDIRTVTKFSISGDYFSEISFAETCKTGEGKMR
jgi:hypothetical protein